MFRLALVLAFAQVGFHAFIASLPLALVAAGKANAEIGTIMGAAALIPIGAALVAGGLIDRYGARTVFLIGTAAFASAAALLATGAVAPDDPTAWLLLPRVLQGLGLAFVMPSALSLVPAFVPRERLGMGLGLVGTGANISLAISPPVSLLILDGFSIRAVGVVTVVLVALAALLIWPMRVPPPRPQDESAGRLRAFRPAWRPAWTGPLLVSLLYVAHWGVVTGYLPQRAEASGADPGLFFTADALGVLLLRVPAGYLAGRFGTRPLVLSGLAMTAATLALLLPALTTVLLILSGVGTGAGAAFILPPVTLELSNRSTDADRGSAMALFNVAFSGGIAVGSIGLAPVIGILGFNAALLGGIAACGVAAAVALVDRPRAPLPAVLPADPA